MLLRIKIYLDQGRNFKTKWSLYIFATHYTSYIYIYTHIFKISFPSLNSNAITFAKKIFKWPIERQLKLEVKTSIHRLEFAKFFRVYVIYLKITCTRANFGRRSDIIITNQTSFRYFWRCYWSKRSYVHNKCSRPKIIASSIFPSYHRERNLTRC